MPFAVFCSSENDQLLDEIPHTFFKGSSFFRFSLLLFAAVIIVTLDNSFRLAEQNVLFYVIASVSDRSYPFFFTTKASSNIRLKVWYSLASAALEMRFSICCFNVLKSSVVLLDVAPI